MHRERFRQSDDQCSFRLEQIEKRPLFSVWSGDADSPLPGECRDSAPESILWEAFPPRQSPTDASLLMQIFRERLPVDRPELFVRILC